MTLLPPATAYGRDFLTEICQLLGFEFRPTDAETLAQLGWLKREPLDEGGVGYTLHPLILDVAFRELGVTAEWADVVIDHVRGLINYENTNPQHNLQEKRALQPYGEHLGKLFWAAETEAVSDLLDRWAELEIQYGFYANAARLGARALAIAEKNGSEEIIAARQSNLANVYGYLGEHARARDLLEAALASGLKIFGTEHPNVARCRNNLAHVFFAEKNYPAAVAQFEEVLRIVERALGRAHPYFKICSEHLAAARQAAAAE
jgi:tetratricopeptide (TPR) repeat protein